MIIEKLCSTLSKDAALPAEPMVWRDKRGRLTARASCLSECPRMLWYNLNGAESAPVSVDLQLAREEGKEFEKRVIKLLKRSGLDIRHQQKTLTKRLNGVILKGHIDCMLYVANEPVAVIDAKRQRWVTNRELADKHNLQLQAYLYMTGLDVGIVIANMKASRYEAYRSRSISGTTKHLREVMIAANTEALGVVATKIASLEKQEPERLPTGRLKGLPFEVHPWQCLYCRYNDLCLPEARLIKVNAKPKLISGGSDAQSTEG